MKLLNWLRSKWGMVMDLETETIYIELLDEGTDVWRPVQGRRIRGNAFEILAAPDYDPELEIWQFVPGSVVECEWETHSGAKLVAKRVAARQHVDDRK